MKIFLCLALLGCSAVAAHADLSYTQSTSMSLGGMMGNMGGGATKMAMKGNMTRTETSAMGSKTIFITRGDGSTLEIDPSTKTYATITSTPKPKGPGAMPPGMMPSEVTVSVKKLGYENIRGVRAPHWRIDMQMKMKTKSGSRNMDMGTEIWSSTTPYPKMTGAAAMKKLPGNLAAMMNNKVKIKGDVKNMGAAYATVPLRMKILMNGQAFTTIETTGISTQTLPASLFGVPAGYRKVSPAQFQKARQAAMSAKMKDLFKGMPGAPR